MSRTCSGEPRSDRAPERCPPRPGVATRRGSTDHGTAGPVFVAGSRVRGGYFGRQPSLTDLDQGDLRATTDFRDVYATLIESVLGTDPGAVLADHQGRLADLLT